MNDFVNYCFSFYGRNGIYDIGASVDEIIAATEARILNYPDFEFVGDSVDRELVRDIILEKRHDWSRLALFQCNS